MISVVGTGPGAGCCITEIGRKNIEEAEILIGAPRHLDQFSTGCETFCMDGRLLDTVEYIRKNSDKCIVVLASGDPNLYGIAGFLGKYFKLKIINGISAVQYLFSKISLDMNDIYITSSHGREPDLDLICAHKKVAVVTDKKTGPVQLANLLIFRGCNKKMIVGENLSYDNERISYFDNLEQVAASENFDMNIVILYDMEVVQ